MVVNAQVDRSHPRKNTPRVSRGVLSQSILCDLLDKYELVDIWHALYPTACQYTFYSATHQSHSRIDLILCSKTLFNACTSADIVSKLLSDHAWVTCLFSLRSGEEKGPVWFLNRTLIKDELYSPKIEEIKTFFKFNSDCGVATPVVWDAFKATLRGHLISLASTCKKERVAIIADLKCKIYDLEAKHLKFVGKHWLRKLLMARKKIGADRNIGDPKNLLFLRQSFTTKLPRYLRWLNWRVKKRLAAKYITNLVSASSAGPITLSKAILGEFETFYKNLYSSSKPSLESIRKFLNNHHFDTKLKEEHQRFLDKPFSVTEVQEIIKTMKRNKAVGRDGFPIEFYAKYGSILLEPFVNTCNFALEQGVVQETWKEARIIVLPKPGKDVKLVGSYRPISLLNHNAKQFAAVLAKRLNTFITQYIHSDQTRFMPSRQINDNIRRSLNFYVFVNCYVL